VLVIIAIIRRNQRASLRDSHLATAANLATELVSARASGCIMTAVSFQVALISSM